MKKVFFIENKERRKKTDKNIYLGQVLIFEGCIFKRIGIYLGEFNPWVETRSDDV